MQNLAEANDQTLNRWQHAIQQVCGQFITHLPAGAAPFIGQIECENNVLALTHIRTNAGRLVRQGTNADREDVDHCFLIVNNSGFTRISHEGCQMELAPGEIGLLNGIRPCEIVPRGLVEHVSVPLPRQRLEQSFGNRVPLFGKVDQTTTSGLLVRTMLDRMAQLSGTQPNADRHTDAVLEALLALLKPAIRHEDCSGIQQAQPFHRDLWQAAQFMINRDLLEEITPAQLAERLNISVRQLHRVFEEQNDSVCRYILRTRLQRCAEDLRDPQLINEAVTTIGYKWGFSDAAHFSRSFKKQYGVSPRSYRLDSFNLLAG